MTEQEFEAKKAFYNDFALIVQQIPPIPQKGINSHLHNTYSTLDDIRKIVNPILANHGFVLRFYPNDINGSPAMTALLSHYKGYEEAYTGLLHDLEIGKGMNYMQAQGSQLTYTMRYWYNMILGLQTGGDDDGVGSGVSHSQPTKGKPYTAPPPPKKPLAPDHYRRVGERFLGWRDSEVNLPPDWSEETAQRLLNDNKDEYDRLKAKNGG
jgi:hypothetical protein